jgi:hypothetical protein
MPALTLNILGASKPPAKHSSAVIQSSDGGAILVLPVTYSTGFDQVGARWTEQDRPGDDPLTLYGGRKAVRAQLGVVVQGKDRTESVETKLDWLRAMARRSLPIIVAFGRTAAWSPTGQWVIDDMPVTVEARVQGSNAIARAVVDLSLIAAMTPDLAIARTRR